MDSIVTLRYPIRTAATCAGAGRLRLLSVIGRPVSSVPTVDWSRDRADPAAPATLNPVGGRRVNFARFTAALRGEILGHTVLASLEALVSDLSAVCGLDHESEADAAVLLPFHHCGR